MSLCFVDLFRAVGRSSLLSSCLAFPHGGENLPEKGSTKHGRVFTHLSRALLCLPRLSLCEKALAEYLDMKRLAFPRFYFISSADLLDILSNGTNPQLVRLVLHHLCIFRSVTVEGVVLGLSLVSSLE